jgi:hypothetical protein
MAALVESSFGESTADPQAAAASAVNKPIVVSKRRDIWLLLRKSGAIQVSRYPYRASAAVMPNG